MENWTRKVCFEVLRFEKHMKVCVVKPAFNFLKSQSPKHTLGVNFTKSIFMINTSILHADHFGFKVFLVDIDIDFDFWVFGIESTSGSCFGIMHVMNFQMPYFGWWSSLLSTNGNCINDAALGFWFEPRIQVAAVCHLWRGDTSVDSRPQVSSFQVFTSCVLSKNSFGSNWAPFLKFVL